MRNFASIIILLFAVTSHAQQKVVPLYNGVAPGSETWNWKEGETSSNPMNMKVAYNVTKPTLTVLTPDTANGTAVILFPGGGFRMLNIENEGRLVANALTAKGITVFLLKYRVLQTKSDNPFQETLESLKDTQRFQQETTLIRQLATDDALAALAYVRQHAVAYKIHPQKVGVIGFSAGGALAIRLATDNNLSYRPDFTAFIYSVYNPEAYDAVPANAPPAFIACATDDALAHPSNSMNLYKAWLEANRPAELHIYAKGGHGLRSTKASGAWIARFEEWLAAQGFLAF